MDAGAPALDAEDGVAVVIVGAGHAPDSPGAERVAVEFPRASALAGAFAPVITAEVHARLATLHAAALAPLALLLPFALSRAALAALAALLAREAAGLFPDCIVPRSAEHAFPGQQGKRAATKDRQDRSARHGGGDPPRQSIEDLGIHGILLSVLVAGRARRSPGRCPSLPAACSA
jgi:hypothetical protein